MGKFNLLVESLPRPFLLKELNFRPERFSLPPDLRSSPRPDQVFLWMRRLAPGKCNPPMLKWVKVMNHSSQCSTAGSGLEAGELSCASA